MFRRFRQLNPGVPFIRLLHYAFFSLLARVLFTLVYGLRVYGSQNMPKDGAVVVIANHQSFFDPPVMGSSLRRHVFTIARSSLFRNRIFKAFIESVNAIPIQGNQNDTGVFKMCERHLAKGRTVLIFPEGERTEDGTVGEFKRGTLLLLRRSKAPVLPMAIEGAYDNWPKHESRPRLRGPIHLRIGEVIPSEEILSLPPDEALSMLRDRVECLRLELRGQIRVETNGRFPPPGVADFHHVERDRAK